MKNKKIATVLIASLFGVLMMGCSKAPDMPDWWNKVDTKGYVTGRGVAPMGKRKDLNHQNNQAMLYAQADLAGKVESTVVRLAAEEDNDGETESLTNVTLKAATQKLLKNFKLLKSEYNDDGSLFIQLGVKKTDIKKIIDNK